MTFQAGFPCTIVTFEPPDAIGCTGDLVITMPKALWIAWSLKLPVVYDRGERRDHGARERFGCSYNFRGGNIWWVKE